MWLFVLPTAALWFAVFGVRKVLKAPRTDQLNETKPEETTEDKIDIVVGTSNSELEESGIPVVSDILKWIEDASIRLEITNKPEVMKVGSVAADRSTFLRFTSKGVEMNLWLSGPEYMGPFPRLCLADGEATGFTIERTAVDFEKAVNEIRKV